MRLEDTLNKILIVDFGSQFTQLIARKIRELGVYCEIISHKKIEKFQNFEKNIKGIVLSGGPLNVYESKKVKFNSKLLKLGTPVLGICFGHQIISKTMGGSVRNSKYREFGLAEVKEIKKSKLTKNFFSKGKNNVWMSHADQVTKLPKNFKIIAQSNNSKMCIIENVEKKMFGIQFHPEVSHTRKGKLILKNFIFSICKLTKNWSSRDQKKKLINEVRNSVGNSKVICALSGGVDSLVIDSLGADQTPNFASEDEEIVYRVTQEINITRQLSDETYDQVIKILGVEATVDLIGLLGYYALISMTIKAFNIPGIEDKS